ncbi:MAG: hypothetical protein QMB78_08030, partial [Rhodospirillales bacterium]
SSADWMPRYFYRRIETIVQIYKLNVHRLVLHEIMAINLKDEMQSWVLSSDGQYSRVGNDQNVSSHEYFLTHISHSGQGEEKNWETNYKPAGRSGR